MHFKLTFMTTGFSKLYMECAFLWMNFWNSGPGEEKRGSQKGVSGVGIVEARHCSHRCKPSGS